MSVAPSTFVIDLAALGVLSDGPAGLDAVCRHVQSVCRPWLAPTGCVVHDRVIAALGAGWVAVDDAERLTLTAAGRARLRALLLEPVDAAAHGLLPLIETLKLALADALDADGRQRLRHELVALRTRCLEAQADVDGEGPALVRRCRERRRRAATLAHQALAREFDRCDGAVYAVS
ncbi:MAG: hypothetical protein ACLFTL_04500 [Alphaproteobacteria bacterium]